MRDYREINRHSWNNRVKTHPESRFYDLEGFLKGESSLKEVELGLLGDLRGKTLLHLQCHFGQDSISLGRLGAKVTGVDLSDKAIEEAVKLSRETGTEVSFICSDLYDLPLHLDRKFDLVFSSYGTIQWLPDLNKWAELISHFLKPGGRFIFVDFHPVLWMFDDKFQSIKYRYFNSGPIEELESGTYADRKAPLSQKSITWNHGIAEILNPLIMSGLRIDSFREYDFSPYDCFDQTVQIAPGKYRIAPLKDRVPMLFSLTASKNSSPGTSFSQKG